MVATRVHINIPVSDLEASVSFYSKVFGVAPSKRRPDYANFRLEEPALHLALVETCGLSPKAVQNGEGQHFGIELFVDETLAAWKERVKDAGVLPHLVEEAVTCCYAVADKFWLQDPDGNEWEFWVRHDDEGDTLYSSTESTSCCPTTTPVPVGDSCCPTTPLSARGCCPEAL